MKEPCFLPLGAQHREKTLFLIEKHIGNITPNNEHFHDLFEFYYLKKGTATYLINDKIYNLTKGDIVVIPPNTLHKTISSNGSERERILFYLDKNFIISDLRENMTFPNEPAIYHTDNDTRIKTIFDDMLDEFNTLKNHIYLNVLICELLILFKRANKNSSQQYQKDCSSGIISDVLAYITANFSDALTLQKIAEHFFTNPSYLSRLFKQHTGFTFCGYLNNYRIQEANKLLSETNKSIIEIALECGFNSSNNFCKCYKKIMQITPLTYRKHITKK